MYKLKAVLCDIRHEEHGQALIEFAISCVLFLTLIAGTAGFAFAMYAYHFVSYSAQQAARYAIVHGGDWSSTCAAATSYGCNATSADVQEYIRSIAPLGIVANQITVTTTWPGTAPSGSSANCSPANMSGCIVNVTISYPFGMNFPLVPATTLQLSAKSEMVIQQ